MDLVKKVMAGEPVPSAHRHRGDDFDQEQAKEALPNRKY